jgi:hypothetical protein
MVIFIKRLQKRLVFVRFTIKVPFSLPGLTLYSILNCEEEGHDLAVTVAFIYLIFKEASPGFFFFVFTPRQPILFTYFE